jgi:hypothetical protein
MSIMSKIGEMVETCSDNFMNESSQELSFKCVRFAAELADELRIKLSKREEPQLVDRFECQLNTSCIVFFAT